MSGPTHHADTMGREAALRLHESIRKSHGIYLTPEPIAHFMAAHLIPSEGDHLRLLDPAAGSGVLPCAVIEHLVNLPTPPASIHVVAYEIQPELHAVLEQSLAYAIEWAAARGVEVTAETRCADYIAAQATRPLLCEKEFDLIIANPPYFKLGRQDPRSLMTAHLVPSQPNIYSLFLALSALALKPSGQLIYIIPRSFSSGVYFKPFRQDFFARIKPLHIHLFGSRRQAFKQDAVLQENIIFHGQRQENWRDADITMSHSDGIADLPHSRTWITPFTDLVDITAPGLLLRLPESPEDQELMHTIDSLPETFATLGLSISTGPVVAFRARDLIVDSPTENTVPLLWLHHVSKDGLRWPALKRTGQYIVSINPKLLVPMQNAVLLRRFSAKDEPRRITAAPLLHREFSHPAIGLENHLNYLYRPGGGLTEDEAIGIAAILNSRLIDRYIRAVSGNTQVGASELRSLPIPSLTTINQIGQLAMRDDWNDEQLNRLILSETRKTETAAAD